MVVALKSKVIKKEKKKMRDTKLLEAFKKKVETKFKEMNIFKNLRKEVETGANGTQSYIIKEGVNKGKKATK
jgi:hypothetical protein|tara:strand:+ start:660 stop:875 length:216 start_codon:yes stop_codon:yes gene_type:complete